MRIASKNLQGDSRKADALSSVALDTGEAWFAVRTTPEVLQLTCLSTGQSWLACAVFRNDA
jgi:hypothetical protein